MYESPIKVFHSKLQMQYEDGVMKAIQNAGFDVDKEELLKALQYDRNQYSKGYADAVDDISKAFAERVICEGCSNCTNCYELEKQFECENYKEFMEIAERMKKVRNYDNSKINDCINNDSCIDGNCL